MQDRRSAPAIRARSRHGQSAVAARNERGVRVDALLRAAYQNLASRPPPSRFIEFLAKL